MAKRRTLQPFYGKQSQAFDQAARNAAKSGQFDKAIELTNLSKAMVQARKEQSWQK